MRNLNRKDYVVLVVAIAMAMPALCVLNCNPQAWYINLIGGCYALWLVRKLQSSPIGKAFCKRMEKIETKVFA